MEIALMGVARGMTVVLAVGAPKAIHPTGSPYWQSFSIPGAARSLKDPAAVALVTASVVIALLFPGTVNSGYVINIVSNNANKV